MPNKRKPGKQKLGFWLTPSERGLLKDAAQRAGVNMSDMIRIILIEHAKKEGILK